MRSGPSSTALANARRLVREAPDSGVALPTLVIHGDRDNVVHPVNAERLVEQLRERAEFIDPAAGALHAADEQRIARTGHAYRQRDYLQARHTLLRQVIVEGLGHAWSGGDGSFQFNDDAGPDASRMILDFLIGTSARSRRCARVG